jgi:5-formyltetrahydrofolate cyclo-ligase
MSKVELRKLIKRKVQQLDEKSKADKSRIISKQLASFLLDHNYIHRKIGGFFPLDDEVNWLLENPIPEEVNLSFPLMTSENQMVFKTCKVEDLEVKKAFGRAFREPSSQCSEVNPEVILVPGLAFDRQGNRLGRGKGFYDKFLEGDLEVSTDMDRIKIGICFHDQLVNEVPVDSNDVPVDFILTDKEIVEVGNRREE